MKTNPKLTIIHLLLLLAAPSLPADINTGLIAYYPLDGNALDASGNGRHGTNTGVSFAPAHRGSGAVFSSFGTPYIRVDSIPQIQSNLTIAAWFSPQDLFSFDVGSPLLTRGDAAGEAYFLFVDYEFMFGVINGGYPDVGTFRPSIPRLTDGTFYHAAMVYDAAQGKVRIYLNAVLQGEFPYAQPIHERSEPLYLGVSLAGGYEAFSGILDEVRIYDRALSDSEICELVVPRVDIRASQVEICWESFTNKTYQVQFRSSLTTNMWVDLDMPVQGAGTRLCVFDPILTNQPQRYYRVAVLPTP